MEDHLKNKDRLDREWEAMCAYEADPCSTKVAEDQANMRKNRYSDVLPCKSRSIFMVSLPFAKKGKFRIFQAERVADNNGFGDENGVDLS